MTSLVDPLLAGLSGLFSARALQILIVDQATYDQATALRRGGEALADSILEWFKPLKKKAFEAHKALCVAETEQLTPLVSSVALLKRCMATWELEQECLRRAEEVRLTTLARQEQEELLLQVAVEAESLGAAQEDVDAILREVPAPLAVTAPPTYQQASGYAQRETWRPEVYDLMALVKAVAQGSVPLAAVEANMTVLGAQARSLRSIFNWPGCRAVPETTSVRTRR